MNWVCQLPARITFSAARIPTGGATHAYFRTSQVVRMYSMSKKENGRFTETKFLNSIAAFNLE
jgi:hypothetical protein